MTPEDVAAAFDVPVELIELAEGPRHPVRTGDGSDPQPGPAAAPTPAWRAIGCTMPGPNRDPYPWCGQPVYGVIRVGTYTLPMDLRPDDRPDPAGVLVCRHHFDAALQPAAPPFPAAPPEAPPCSTSSVSPSPPPP